MSWYSSHKIGPLGQELGRLRVQIAAAAQQVYDQWTQDSEGIDETFGGGGICDEITQAMSGVISGSLQCEITDGGQDGDDHSYLIAYRGQEAYGVDIPAGVYETGGGYSWQKIPGITITPNDVEIYPIDLPDGFHKEVSHFAANGKGKEILDGRLGRCYELAGRYVSQSPGAELVHGHVFNPFNRNGSGKGFVDIDHAWVEEGGKVFDPVMNKWWSKDMYNHLFNVQEQVRYGQEQVLKMILQQRHWGPWSSNNEIAQKKVPTGVSTGGSNGLV